MQLKFLITAREVLVDEAADLIGESGEADNPEYMRGIVELIANVTRGAVWDEGPGFDPDNAKDNVERDIRDAMR